MYLRITCRKIYFICSCAFAILSVALATNGADVAALQAVQSNFAINDWLGGDPCAPAWAGVTCEGDRVVALQLPDQNLEGVLAREINALTALQILDLSGNPGIKGQIPDLSNLTSLTRLILTNCSLSGPVPQSMSGLTLLERLDLAYNDLSGNLPYLGKMAVSDWLDVTGNPQLGGPVSQLGLEKLATVKHVHFSGCNFSGPLPADLSGMSMVVHILFDRNNLAGPMPAKLPPKLVVLQLSYNSLGGVIPPAYFKHPTLQELRMNWCKITMSLLTDLPTTESGITILTLRGNYPGISGELPGTLSDTFPNLKYFDVSGNNLRGSPSIPKWVQMTQLSTIRLQNNHFDGMLDAAVTLPSSTQRTLDIRNNDLIATEVDPGVFMGANFSLRLLNNPICDSGGQSPQVQQACGPMGFNPPKAPSNAFCISLPCPANKLPNYGFFLKTGQCQCDSFLKAVLAFPVLPTGPDQFRLLSHQLEIEMAAELGVTVDYVFVPAAEMLYSDADTTISTPPDGGTATIYFFNPNGGDLDPQFVQKATKGISARSVHLNSFFLFQVVSLMQPVISSAAQEKNKLGTGAIIGIVLGSASLLLLLLMAILLLFLVKRKKKAAADMPPAWQQEPYSKEIPSSSTKQHSRGMRHSSFDSVGSVGTTMPSSATQGGARQYLLEDLRTATNNFSESNILGVGAFGTVYKGIMMNNAVVAVKRGKAGLLEKDGSFNAEVVACSRVAHKNLVQLLGFCVDGEEQILVYEYCGGGSLHSHVHPKDVAKEHVMPFDNRLQAAIGAARGLAYLHHDLAQPIIHGDVKLTNILLDSNFEAKVGDFGFARILEEQGDHYSTAVKGTAGYVDPQYYYTRQLTTMSDVYSFGVCLLEMITARRAIQANAGGSPNLVSWVKERLTSGGGAAAVVDPHMPGASPELVHKVAVLGLHCAQEEPGKRPKMQEVHKELESIQSGSTVWSAPPGRTGMLPTPAPQSDFYYSGNLSLLETTALKPV